MSGNTTMSTTAGYALAQILVCGAISWEEFREANNFTRKTQKKAMVELQQKNLLDKTLYEGKRWLKI